MKSSPSGGSKFGFVRRVLTRTSSRIRSASRSSSNTVPGSIPDMDNSSSGTPRSSAKFQSELLLLKSQIESLEISVHHMQNDNASKDKALAVASREKEQLSVDLKKQRRSNANLRQQLEDERNFYYKEKEQYCHEMNQKKHRGDDHSTPLSAQKEIAELKNTLNQTLEANYNLSVKFLRMKNTKLELKNQLVAVNKRHNESSKYFKDKVEEYKRHLDSIVKEQLYEPIPPSSKKYLHLLKGNGALIHENLQLQMEVDRLHTEIEKQKFVNVRNETNHKLKLIHHDNVNNKAKSSKSPKNNKSKSSIHNICSRCKLKTNSPENNKSGRSVTSYSRSSQTPSISTSRSRHHQHNQHVNSSSKSIISSLHESELSMDIVKIEKHGKLTTSSVDNASETQNLNPQSHVRYDLMTVSNSNIDQNSIANTQSNSSMDSNKCEIGIKSSPAILQLKVDREKCCD